MTALYLQRLSSVMHSAAYSNTTAAAAAAASTAAANCRICREGADGSEQLCQPCQCRGTLAHIHPACLRRWLQLSRSTRCEICRQPFLCDVASSTNSPSAAGYGRYSPMLDFALRCCLAVLVFLSSGWLARSVLFPSKDNSRMIPIDFILGLATSTLTLALVWSVVAVGNLHQKRVYCCGVSVFAIVAELLGLLATLEVEIDADSGVWFRLLPRRLSGLALANYLLLIVGCYLPVQISRQLIDIMLIDTSVRLSDFPSFAGYALLLIGLVVLLFSCQAIRSFLLPPLLISAAPLATGGAVLASMNFLSWSADFSLVATDSYLMNYWLLGAVCLLSSRHLVWQLLWARNNQSNDALLYSFFCYFDVFFRLSDANLTVAMRAGMELAGHVIIGAACGTPIVCLVAFLRGILSSLLLQLSAFN